MPWYARKGAGGALSACLSMHKKLPVAGSLHVKKSSQTGGEYGTIST